MIRPSTHLPRAFTLVEILIVVVIIGILAAIAVPKLSNAAQLARENTLKDDLRLMRTALGVYKTQHFVSAGYPAGDSSQTPTQAATFNQLLQYTDANGDTSANGSALYKYGPYLNVMPVNPLNNSSDWKILTDSDPFTPDGTTGWLYQPTTGLLKANVPGTDSTGHNVVDY